MVEKDKVEKIDKDKIDYNTDLEYLLKIHAEECESFSILHRYSYEKYNEIILNLNFLYSSMHLA